jgi:serine protease Do
MKPKIPRIDATRVWITLIAGVLLAGLFFRPGVGSAADALSKANLNRDELGTVKLLILDPSGKVFGICSGTHLGDGVILTAWHCVGHTDLYGPDDTGMDLKNGETYNQDGILGIAPQTDPRQIPKPTYLAHVVSGNPDLDIAVIKIFRMIDPKTTLPNALPIPSIVLTDSNSVAPGDDVYVFGYPGAGGERITFTKGTISGFEDQDGDGTDDSFTTDAAINPGNSGGLSANSDGDQIGISTFASTSESGPGLGGIREGNLAVPYVNQALKLGDSTPGPLPSQTVVAATPQATPGANTQFGPIAFGTDIEGGKLVNQSDAFDTGAKQIVGVFAFQNMRNGMKWGAVWQYNGQPAIDQRNDGTWNNGAKGTTGVSLSLDEGLPDGTYDLILYINNAPVQQGTFTIGNATAQTTPEVPSTPGPNETGVTLKGQIIDADTEEGIPGAVILVLKPGVSIDDLTNDNLEANTAAFGQADQDGFYITAPGIDRGNDYTVIVVADGYQPGIFEDGLTINSDDPDLVELENIPLTAR